MTNPTSRQPSELALDLKQRILQITWQDGHISQYDFDTLRRHCPCAECRTTPQGMVDVGVVPDKLKDAKGDLVSADAVKFVGSYAINILFADGHGTGIYTWHYLRDLSAHLEKQNDRTNR
jgi:prepilin-type processing-associated H-X9-DG protein